MINFLSHDTLNSYANYERRRKRRVKKCENVTFHLPKINSYEKLLQKHYYDRTRFVILIIFSSLTKN